jgi:DNA-binding LacI/PurR family transcriptional regulator
LTIWKVIVIALAKIMSVTINKIAELAGVSKATVSLVLNMKPGVGTDTRERVLEIAERLNYKLRKGPVVTEAQLKTIRFLRIAKHGHIINPDHKVFISDYIDGLEKESRNQGFNLEISSFDHFSQDEIFFSINPDKISGIIVLATELDETDLDLFRTVQIPVVFIDSYHDYLNYDFVDMDNKTSVFKIVQYFVNLGHKRLGYVKGSIETRNFRLREQSFIESLERFGLTLREEDCFSIDSTYEKGYSDMSILLQKRKEMPTALFCLNDIIAYGCAKALSEKGYVIPDNISVIGFDDLPSNEYMTPPLTSIKVSKHDIGIRAIQLMALRLANPERPTEKTVIGGELVVRKSVLTLNNNESK